MIDARATTVLAATAAGALALAVVTIALLGGFPTRGHEGIKAASAAEEYRAEASELELPAGVRWPPRLSLSTAGPDGAPMRYEPGYARVRADLYWLCAWARSAGSAASSNVRDHAVATVSGITKLYYFTTALDAAGRRDISSRLRAARHGRLEPLNSFVAANCPPGE